MLEHALAYAEAGIAVFPLAPKTKIPVIGTHGVKDATTDLDIIKTWWTKWPEAGIGVAMGRVSGIFGLDGDYDDGLREGIESELPPTVTSRSPTGKYKNFHKFYKYPPGGIKNGKIELGLTIRSDGLYFVAPPSIHPIEGLPYVFEGRGLADGEISEPAPWMIPRDVKPAEEVRQGERHDTLVKRAAYYRRAGKDYNWTLSKLIEINNKFPDGAKPESELKKALDSAWAKFESDEPVAGSPQEDRDARDLIREGLELVISVHPLKSSAGKLAKKILKRIFFTSETPYNMAREFLETEGFADLENNVHFLKYYRNEFYRYRISHYQKLDDEWLVDRINRWLIKNDWKTFAGTDKVEKIFNILKIKPIYIGGQISLPAKRVDGGEFGEWECAKDVVPMKNGLLDVANERLLPHSPDYFFNYHLPFSYDANETCPIYDKLCDEIFSSPGQKDIWEEIMGVHIYNPFLVEKMFILLGDGANGKSVMTTILGCLLGSENISAVPIECFSPNNFAFVETLGKLANIIADMNDISNIDEGALKAFISREEMVFNRKNKPVIKARPTAFLTACTNVLPKFSDKTDGIWRRIILLDFKNKIRETDRNPAFRSVDFWINSGELPGIFNRALAGAKRVVARGYINETKETMASLEDYRQELNYAAQFVRDYLEFEPHVKVPSHPVYAAYKNMVIKGGNKPFAAKAFFHQIINEAKKMGHELEITKKTERTGGYIGKFLLHAKLNEFGELLSVENRAEKPPVTETCNQQEERILVTRLLDALDALR